MKTQKSKRMTTFLAAAALAIIATLLPIKAMAEIDKVEESPKTWEYGIGLGYVDYKEDEAQSSGYADIRAMKRLAYPWLVGPGLTFSATGNVLYLEGNIPVILRVPVGPVRADILLRPGIAYAKNTDLDVSKIMGVGTFGLELKKFVTKGTSVGIGAYYSLTTYSNLNSFKIGIIVGF